MNPQPPAPRTAEELHRDLFAHIESVLHNFPTSINANQRDYIISHIMRHDYFALAGFGATQAWGDTELAVMADMAAALEEINRQTIRVREGQIDAHSQVGTIAIQQCRDTLAAYREWKRKPKLRPIAATPADLRDGERFKTSEEYFADKDLFCRYVHDRVNPARLAEGLSVFNDAAINRLYDIAINGTHRAALIVRPSQDVFPST